MCGTCITWTFPYGRREMWCKKHLKCPWCFASLRGKKGVHVADRLSAHAYERHGLEQVNALIAGGRGRRPRLPGHAMEVLPDLTMEKRL